MIGYFKAQKVYRLSIIHLSVFFIKARVYHWVGFQTEFHRYFNTMWPATPQPEAFEGELRIVLRPHATRLSKTTLYLTNKVSFMCDSTYNTRALIL